MSFAIIETGSKQYLVFPKDRIKVEKLFAKAGSEVIFDKVLLVSDKETKVGRPYVKGAKVVGKVSAQGSNRKLSWIKHKAKTRYRRHKGHRQSYTEVEITKIT